jgi:hypothetical protein
VIFIVFLIPLGVYLLVLGYINRQPRPVFVSGTWDFIGILFAGSGFLLFGGPAVLSSLNESWRHFWLLGETSGARDNLLEQRLFWLTLSALYFLLVVAGSALILWRQRHRTSIYNVEPALVEAVLEEVCEQHGLAPIRSGNLFVFGLSLDRPAFPPAAPAEGIQAPHALPLLAQKAPVVASGERPDEILVGQNAVLEVEPFETMRHVTLRWDPADSPLRPVIEAELQRRLQVLGAPYHDTGTILTLIGHGVLGLSLLIGFALVLRQFLMR